MNNRILKTTGVRSDEMKTVQRRESKVLIIIIIIIITLLQYFGRGEFRNFMFTSCVWKSESSLFLWV